jgi:hypothetical protein
MKQQTLAMAADQNAQYEQYRRPTKRDTFLATMEEIVPWVDLIEDLNVQGPSLVVPPLRLNKGAATLGPLRFVICAHDWPTTGLRRRD